MLIIKNLNASSEDKKILKNLCLEVEKGKVCIVMGPNGSGKSTLAKAIMGHPSYKVDGEITFDGKSIMEMAVDERAKNGIFITFQEPPEIEGVSVLKMLSKVEKDKKKHIMKLKMDMEKDAEKIGVTGDMLTRELNVGFSGGEKKRMELIQMLHLKPKLIIVDEIDSGLDVDGMKQLKHVIDELKKQESTFVLITHQTRLFQYVKPDLIHILKDGKIVASGGIELSEKIENEGYKWMQET